MGNLIAPLQSWENGEYITIDGAYSFNKGVLDVKDFDFHGDELNIRSAGQVNLLDKTVSMGAIGDIPRYNTEGKIGKATSVISIGGLVDFIAKGTSLKTPEVPLLGNVSPAAKRTFAFQINADLYHPKTIAHSILKSFRWTNISKRRTETSFLKLPQDGKSSSLVSSSPNATK